MTSYTRHYKELSLVVSQTEHYLSLKDSIFLSHFVFLLILMFKLPQKYTVTSFI